MTVQAQAIVEQVLSLPASTREEVLTQLIKSLDADQPPSPQEQAEINTAWQAEIERRAQEVDEGRIELLDGDEAMAKIRDKFGV